MKIILCITILASAYFTGNCRVFGQPSFNPDNTRIVKCIGNGGAGDYSSFSNDQIADAIYMAEGGSKAKVPYGILSVKVKDEQEARRVCINTIRNNRKRFTQSVEQNDFIDFLADRYCPKSVDPIGNKNWKVNVKRYLHECEKVAKKGG